MQHVAKTEQTRAIEDALTAASTKDEVEAVAAEHRETVKAMHKDPAEKVHAIHIVNLKHYRLMCIDRGWG